MTARNRQGWGLRATLVAAVLAALAGCARREGSEPARRDIDCMARAMYFESIRSSRDGLIAVGSVVMNRVRSGDFPETVCGVVGQKNQFAPGVMTRAMDERSAPMVREAAASVLRGERHPLIGNAQFFHAISYRANYNNMHYTVSAGGNAFYEKRRPENVTQPYPLPLIEGLTGS